MEISQNFPKNNGFQWTKPRIQAAMLLAEDELSDEQIAQQVGVDRRTLTNWKQHPQFRARIQANLGEIRKRVMESGIAVKANRVKRLNDSWQKMQEVIRRRSARYTALIAEHESGTLSSELAEDLEENPAENGEGKKVAQRDAVGNIPDEAATGLVILKRTPTKHGFTEEWAVDTGLLAELRQTEQQAAKELGQWVDKSEHEIRDTGTLEMLERRLLPEASPGSDSPVPQEPDTA